MPEHVWSVLCSKGCLDKFTNLVSIHDVIEGITLRVPALPQTGETISVQMQSPLHLVSLWVRSKTDVTENFDMRVVIGTPDGEEFHPAEPTHVEMQEYVRNRTFLRLPALMIRGRGTYRLFVECRSGEDANWERLARIPVEVQFEVQAPESTIHETPTV